MKDDRQRKKRFYIRSFTAFMSPMPADFYFFPSLLFFIHNESTSKGKELGIRYYTCICSFNFVYCNDKFCWKDSEKKRTHLLLSSMRLKTHKLMQCPESDRNLKIHYESRCQKERGGGWKENNLKFDKFSRMQKFRSLVHGMGNERNTKLFFFLHKFRFATVVHYIHITFVYQNRKSVFQQKPCILLTFLSVFQKSVENRASDFLFWLVSWVNVSSVEYVYNLYKSDKFIQCTLCARIALLITYQIGRIVKWENSIRSCFTAANI